MRERWPDLVAVAVTGHGMSAHVEESRAKGFCAHLTKPVDVQRLVETIDHCMATATGEHAEARPFADI